MVLCDSGKANDESAFYHGINTPYSVSYGAFLTVFTF